ncbi:MAG: PAS domain S-box protein, partial [Bacteroidales bacterium]|nr:PAS domain S-box protein [Bacteroidales bacterium]
MKNKVKLKLSSKGQVAFYITIIAVIFAIGGYWYYGREKEQIIQQNERTLSAIVTLKAKKFEMWYNEELKDAQIVSSNTYLKEVVESYVRSNSLIDKTLLLELLQQDKLEHGYSEVFLTSSEGNIIAATNSQIATIYPDELRYLKDVIQHEKTFSTSFFKAMQNGNKQIFISFISPLYIDLNNLSYAIIMRRDASNDIMPLIESWPTESQTGESFIFSIETNNILFFSETKHQVEIETRDKLIVKDDDLLSKIYTSGQPGIFQGKDYRNVDVLASMSKIEGTNCVLIAKVDKSELLQELSGEALSIIAWVLLLVALSGLFIMYWFNTRQKNIYKGLLEKEQELWLQQEKFNVVMDSIGDGIITLDLNGTIQYINNRAEALTGWNLREARGRDYHEVYNVINEDTGQQENNILDKVFKKGFAKELGNHTILITKNGTQIPVMDTGAPLIDSSGKIMGIVISFQDETEKRQQRRLLVESEARHREFFEADLTGDYIATTDGEILQCNSAFVEILGYDSAEGIIGRNIAEMYQNPAERKEFLNLIQNQKVIRDYKSKLKRKDGTNIICNENIVGKFDAKGDMVQYIGYMYDITEQIHAEEEIRKSEKFFRLIFANSPDVLFIQDCNLTYTFIINPAPP